MRYVEFYRKMSRFTVFSIKDVRMIDPRFDRRRLHEWCSRGYIKLLAKGFYLFSDIEINDEVLDLIANRIYAPSYVSLETILSRASLIPDTVRQVTLITTQKTRTVRMDIGTFSYRTVAPRLFFGYTIGARGEKTAAIEKAVLDYLYLHADLRTQADYESLRVDRAQLVSKLDVKRFEDYLARFDVKALRRRAELFMKWVRYA